MTKTAARRRHVPQRTCVTCRRTDSKRTLVRIVRTKEQGVLVDPTGKLAGRGAYLCADQACWTKALKIGALNRALKTTLTEDEVAALRVYASSLPELPDEQDEPELADA
ncbi:MAG: YlxR family protein [Caldilineaceae bacterium]|nr:YlxR family protein [Caldilineaceae bacterium]